MTPDHHIDTLGLLLGEAVTVSEDFVQHALLRYRVRSASRRGFIIIVGNNLVRLSDETAAWMAQRLPHPAYIADEDGHEHVILPVMLGDGHDVLECTTCGSEW